MNDRIATATSYGELRKLLNNRRIELRLTMLELDERAGLADGHASKIFCGMRNLGPLSLGLVLQALGVKLAVVPASAGTVLSASEIGGLKDGLRSPACGRLHV